MCGFQIKHGIKIIGFFGRFRVIEVEAYGLIIQTSYRDSLTAGIIAPIL